MEATTIMDDYLTLIPTLMPILQNFSGVFTQPNFHCFCQLFGGFILCPARRTITAAIPFADPKAKYHHSRWPNFFRKARWKIATMIRIWAIFLVKAFHPTPATIPLIGDDTVHPKTGRHVRGAKWCRDAVRSTDQKNVSVWGLQIVLLCLKLPAPWGGEPLALPINLRLYRGKGKRSCQKLMAGMIRQTAQWLPAYRFELTVDGEYATLCGNQLPRTTVISRMRRDAAIYELPKPRKPGQRGRPAQKGKRVPMPCELSKMDLQFQLVNTTERGKQRERLVYSCVVLWYKVSGTKPVLLVISRDPEGIQKDDYFVMADSSCSSTDVVEAYSDRWAIEDTFKNVKQHLGIHQPQSWAGSAPLRVAGFGYVVYGIVWYWYIQHGHSKSVLYRPAWNLSKSRPSFKDALSALRSEIWQSWQGDILGSLSNFCILPENRAILEQSFRIMIQALSRAA